VIVHCSTQSLSHLSIKLSVFPSTCLSIWKHCLPQPVDPRDVGPEIWREMLRYGFDEMPLLVYSARFDLGQLFSVSIVPPFEIRDYSTLSIRSSVVYADPEERSKH
jgi:hypothetical protein